MSVQTHVNEYSSNAVIFKTGSKILKYISKKTNTNLDDWTLKQVTFYQEYLHI